MENMNELDLEMLEKIAGGEESGKDNAPINRLQRLVRQAKLNGSSWEETLQVMLQDFKGDLPAGVIEACVKAAYGVLVR